MKYSDSSIAACIVKRGIGIDMKELKTWTTVNIHFFNHVTQKQDAVQFDVENLESLPGYKDLLIRFVNFCKGNELDAALCPVSEVEYVRTAGTYEELKKLEYEENNYGIFDEYLNR